MSETRGVAARVARWLVQKERPDEAVALLSAWAARGPNDTAGQGLLAEALRVLESSKLLGVVFNGDDQPLSPYYGYYARHQPPIRGGQ